MASDVIQPKGPQAGDNSPAVDSTQAEERPEPSAGEAARGRPGGVVVSLVIAGVLLVLGFSPVSRLAAHGLPQAPGSQAPVVTGPQHGKTTAVQAVPAGLPDGAASGRLQTSFPMPSRRWGSRMP